MEVGKYYRIREDHNLGVGLSGKYDINPQIKILLDHKPRKCLQAIPYGKYGCWYFILEDMEPCKSTPNGLYFSGGMCLESVEMTDSSCKNLELPDYQNEYLTADIDGTSYGFDIILNIDAKKLMGNLISKYGIEGASHVTTVKTHLQISLTPAENGLLIDFLHKGIPEEKEPIKDNILEFRR